MRPAAHVLINGQRPASIGSLRDHDWHALRLQSLYQPLDIKCFVYQNEHDQIPQRIAQDPYPGAHAPCASDPWLGFESCALAVTMHFHDRGIDHGVFHIRLAADSIKAFLPDTGLDPVAKAFEMVFHLPNSSGQSHQGLHPQHGLCKQALGRASSPCIARLAQAVRCHQCPLLVG